MAVAVMEPFAAEAATKMAGPGATKMPAAAKMSSASAARERKGGGRHRRRAEGKRCSNDNYRFGRGVP